MDSSTSRPGQAGASRFRRVMVVAAANAAVLLLLLVPVELVFGTWIRPMRLSDIRRFSVPIGAHFDFDTSALYGGPGTRARYTRDDWGLRGSHPSPAAVDVLTVGGSTTEQRYLDDGATWQSVAERELQHLGRPLVFANAGVDGQSTVGHLFNFDYWFPLLPDLDPRVVMFYVGVNDVLRQGDRASFDASVDARDWRVRSATFQLLRTVRSNLRARAAGVYHGRMRQLHDGDFTTDGRLTADQRRQVSGSVIDAFLRNVDALRARVVNRGAMPIFVTQTAYAWTADSAVEPRGLRDTVVIHGVTANYADVAFLHQELNRALIRYCAEHQLTCFDLAHEVAFEVTDYYDYLHNTPAGAERIGRYLAARLHALGDIGRLGPGGPGR